MNLPDDRSLQQRLREFWPRFDDVEREALFRAQQGAEVARRLRVHAPMALAFVVAAGIGHVLLFPRFVWAPILVLLVLFMLVPLTGSFWLVRRSENTPLLYRAMQITSASAVIGVCLVVASARSQGYPLPYEGILLVIMAVFLLSGLRARDAMLTTLTAVVGVMAIEYFWPTSQNRLFWAVVNSDPVLIDKFWPAASTDLVIHSFFALASWLLGSSFCLLIERAERREFLHREALASLAQHDPLTGLLNRRGLEERFALLAATARRDGTPIAVAIVDLDHFKLYNDSRGHEAGDTVLTRTGGELARHGRRPLDVIARMGGEEFLLAWQDADAEAGRQLAENVRAAIAALDIPHAGAPGNDSRVSASIGVTGRTMRPGDTFENYYREADHALYTAKHEGRNRVSLFVDPDA